MESLKLTPMATLCLDTAYVFPRAITYSKFQIMVKVHSKEMKLGICPLFSILRDDLFFDLNGGFALFKVLT